MSASRKHLGLELGGSRRTAVVCLEHSPVENKIFLVEISAHLHGTRELTADEVVIEKVNTLKPDSIGVDAPLTFPPCFACVEPSCPGVSACEIPSVVWMREEAVRQGWSKAKLPAPYTHRPMDLLMRGSWQEEAPMPVPVEEAFGSGRAPLAARMNYLRRHLHCKKLLEVSPRFALLGMAEWYGISVRELRRARDIEHGAENRFTILNKITSRQEGLPQNVLYMTDLVAIAKDLSSFDAYLCAFMAVCEELSLLESPSLDPSWGRVAKPLSRRGIRQSNDAWSDS